MFFSIRHWNPRQVHAKTECIYIADIPAKLILHPNNKLTHFLHGKSTWVMEKLIWCPANEPNDTKNPAIQPVCFTMWLPHATQNTHNKWSNAIRYVRNVARFPIMLVLSCGNWTFRCVRRRPPSLVVCFNCRRVIFLSVPLTWRHNNVNRYQGITSSRSMAATTAMTMSLEGWNRIEEKTAPQRRHPP